MGQVMADENKWAQKLHVQRNTALLNPHPPKFHIDFYIPESMLLYVMVVFPFFCLNFYINRCLPL